MVPDIIVSGTMATREKIFLRWRSTRKKIISDITDFRDPTEKF